MRRKTRRVFFEADLYLFAIFLILLHGPLCLHAQSIPNNLGFERGGVVGVVPPADWYAFSVPAGWDFRTALQSTGCHGGRYCALMSGPADAPSTAYGVLSQNVPTAPYRGRRVTFRVAVRVESPGMKAMLWLRFDRSDGSMVSNLNSPYITSTGWQYYEIAGTVSSEISTVNYGVQYFGNSRVWVDDGSFEVEGREGPPQEGPRDLSETGLANITAFAKLFGYVRHFHPNDQVPKVDWDGFAAQGVRTVESAGATDELASRLRSLFDPIAPTMRIFATDDTPPLPPELQPSAAADLQVVRWNNSGVYLGWRNSIYTSKRQSASAAGEWPAEFVNPTQPFEAPIGRGLSVSLPLTLYADSGGTLPHRPEPPDFCCAYGADDRATRLAGVMVAWNVAQHFYPYFDVVETDWPAALTNALRSAATGAGADNYYLTLSRMWAALHDGHGRTWGPKGKLMIPLVWDWVENQLVVTAVKSGPAPGAVAGDRVLRIDGKRVEDALADQGQLISSATPQHTLLRLLKGLAECADPSLTVQLEIEPHAAPGTSRTIEAACGTDRTWDEPRPDVVTELEPGIMYVDLNRLTDDIWKGAVAGLSKAKGVIFDLRGPLQSFKYLQHLSAEPLNSAQWWIPTPVKPDRVDLTFQYSSWAVPPAQPAIEGRRVFLTDERAVSAAETVMGIVENYKLAEIVGSTTAGTNGNVNYIFLPGDFQYDFTGMKVLKTDGSQHHGVGIRPTIPASRTRKGVAEGRDEVLARGVEVVKGPQLGPVPAIRAVVNAASSVEGPVAPGEIVTIFGTNLGPAELARTTYDDSGYLGTWAGETRVFFDGTQAPLLYALSTQVSAVVPYQLTAGAKIRVEYKLRSSDPFPLQVTGAAPGIFTYTGKSQAIVVNQNGSLNSEANPAAQGEILTLFATGSGAASPAGVTGKLPPAGSKPAGDVAVSFGGIPGEVQFARDIFAGVFQVNVKTPQAAPAGSAIPISLRVGDASSPARATLAIR